MALKSSLSMPSRRGVGLTPIGNFLESKVDALDAFDTLSVLTVNSSVDDDDKDLERLAETFDDFSV
jgi:hypothetical protein